MWDQEEKPKLDVVWHSEIPADLQRVGSCVLACTFVPSRAEPSVLSIHFSQLLINARDSGSASKECQRTGWIMPDLWHDGLESQIVVGTKTWWGPTIFFWDFQSGIYVQQCTNSASVLRLHGHVDIVTAKMNAKNGWKIAIEMHREKYFCHYCYLVYD